MRAHLTPQENPELSFLAQESEKRLLLSIETSCCSFAELEDGEFCGI